MSNKIQTITISVSTLPDEILLTEQELLVKIGRVAGVCYGSSIADMTKCKDRALNCIRKGHHSPFEHVNITTVSIVDRGVSHALVRHRHCAFQQSSTIYQKYNDELQLIAPSNVLLKNYDSGKNLNHAYSVMHDCYCDMLKAGVPASEARDVLPNATATRLIITTNFRQYMYMIQRRCGQGDSEKMHIWCEQMRKFLSDLYPLTVETFDEWYKKHPL